VLRVDRRIKIVLIVAAVIAGLWIIGTLVESSETACEKKPVSSACIEEKIGGGPGENE
jgi:hypothetical protein